MNNERHPLANTLQNLKDFREALINFSAPENVDGWSLSNLPTHFWETIGECIDDIEQHVKMPQERDKKAEYAKALQEYVDRNLKQ